MKYGNAGIVASLENLKVTWQTLIIMVISQFQKVPSNSQFAGMTCGVIGGIFIALNKPKPAQALTNDQRFSLLEKH
jgi:ABC-type transporter Mla subunit MlaD